MEVTLDNKRVLQIEKLPLGRYADLLKAFEELPKHINELRDFKNFTTQQFIELLPQLLGSCLPDFIRVVEIATDLTKEEVQFLGLHEMIDILTAIYTVNNYQAIFEKLKKVAPNRNQMVSNTTPTPELKNLTPID